MKSTFKFWGKVIRGKKRGKELGFPTANISLHSKIPEGIYASKVKHNGELFIAATFIGVSRTFGEEDCKAECYILDFNKDIYGSWVTVKLYKKLRGNKKFESKEELISQIKKDVLATREFFS